MPCANANYAEQYPKDSMTDTEDCSSWLPAPAPPGARSKQARVIACCNRRELDIPDAIRESKTRVGQIELRGSSGCLE
jgi:hypothetical protein